MLLGSLLALLGRQSWAVDELRKLNHISVPTPSLRQAGNCNKTGFIMWSSHFSKQKSVAIPMQCLLVLNIKQTKQWPSAFKSCPLIYRRRRNLLSCSHFWSTFSSSYLGLAGFENSRGKKLFWLSQPWPFGQAWGSIPEREGSGHGFLIQSTLQHCCLKAFSAAPFLL